MFFLAVGNLTCHLPWHPSAGNFILLDGLLRAGIFRYAQDRMSPLISPRNLKIQVKIQTSSRITILIPQGEPVVLDIKKLFKRKPARGDVDAQHKPIVGDALGGSSLPYVESPTALQYPGVKSVETAPAPAKPKTVEIPRPANSLPRCPGCGWSVGFTDEKCSNCGRILRQGP